MTYLILIYSNSIYEALNDSMSILILSNLPQMASKTFIMELSGYYNSIYNSDNYLQVSMPSEEYKPLHVFGQFITLNMIIVQLCLIIFH